MTKFVKKTTIFLLFILTALPTLNTEHFFFFFKKRLEKLSRL